MTTLEPFGIVQTHAAPALRQAFMLLSAICVLLTLSIVRASARLAHRRSLFQVRIDGGERVFDHHSPALEHDHAHARAGHCGEEPGPAICEPERDEPRVSPSAHPGGAVGTIPILPPALGWLVQTRFAAISYAAVHPWNSRSIEAAWPPPRILPTR